MPQKKQTAVIIDWFAYKPEDMKDKQIRGEFPRGFYLATGHLGKKSKSKILYVGISKGDLVDRLNHHHKLGKGERIPGEKIWLGEIATGGMPGRRKKKTPRELDDAEGALIFYLQPPLNDRKKETPPKAVAVLNRWWSDDGKTRREPAHPDWPILIDHMLSEQDVAEALLVWKNRRRLLKLRRQNGRWEKPGPRARD